MGIDSVLFFAVIVATLLGVSWFLWARAKREARDLDALADAQAKNLHIPQTLHPEIDPDICIGSLSCLKVCPEGDILGVIDGKAALINAAACIGHGKCALECPVDAIKLVFGTSQRGLDLPEVNEFFESSRPGIHVVGELGGMGLIKNAMTQGLQCAEYLGDCMKAAARKGAAETDVLIVGAGPAGIATALGCKNAGLSFRVVDQETLGGTVAQYPRQKVVMTERVELPFFGKFGKTLISKEELIELFQGAARKADIQVDERVKVTSIEGADGDFTVQTSAGPMRARKVVLATGRRGSPRKLGARGEEAQKVSYRLIDPEQYDGARVLVVGGGDSALEAAIQLAEQSGCEVTLSYRNADLGRARDANKKKFKELCDRGVISALMPSTVTQITDEQVHLDCAGEQVTIDNDFVIVNIGGELPTEFLSAAGVGLKRHFGTAPGVDDEVKEARARRGSAKQQAEAAKRRRLVLSLFAAGLIILATLVVVGIDYYPLSSAERLKSPFHKLLRPAGDWGHGVGIVATLFMMSNFIYALRKRWSRMKGAGSIRNWLTFHQFVGFMSPVVIAFHAAFQSNNVLATSTAGSLAIVVATGIVGRFIFGLVPTRDGRTTTYSEVVARWERLKLRIEPMLSDVREAPRVRALLSRATAPATRGSLAAMLFSLPFDAANNRRDLLQVQPLFPSGPHYRQFKEAFLRLVGLRRQVSFYQSLKRLLSIWRAFHVVLAVLLVVMISAHIGVSLYLGYSWIFR